MAEAPADATLWFYFAGTAPGARPALSEFALYDEPMADPDVFSTIERRFPGKTALLLPTAAIPASLGTEAMLRAGRVSYGAITSSLACTVSTGTWTFTECLIAGLRGAIR